MIYEFLIVWSCWLSCRSTDVQSSGFVVESDVCGCFWLAAGVPLIMAALLSSRFLPCGSWGETNYGESKYKESNNYYQISLAIKYQISVTTVKVMNLTSFHLNVMKNTSSYDGNKSNGLCINLLSCLVKKRLTSPIIRITSEWIKNVSCFVMKVYPIHVLLYLINYIRKLFRFCANGTCLDKNSLVITSWCIQ